MFRLIIATAALLVASPTFAQSFLCIADKAAWMTVNSKTSQIEVNSGGVENTRFIISKNERGDYEAGWFGSDFKMWNDCHNFIGRDDIPRKLFCEANPAGSVFSGYSFALESDNTFIAKDINADDGSRVHRIIAGKCSSF